MPRAKQRTPELRDRVLDVAITTLGEEGIARFTTRRVAERAGTSVPAVYELFDDKAGLVRAMFFEGFRLSGRRAGQDSSRQTMRWAISSGWCRCSGCSAAPIRNSRR